MLVLGGFVVSGVGFVYAMRGDIKMLALTVEKQGEDVKDMKQVITAQALHDQKLTMLTKTVEELRRGIGWIRTTPDGRLGVDREY